MVDGIQITNESLGLRKSNKQTLFQVKKNVTGETLLVNNILETTGLQEPSTFHENSILITPNKPMVAKFGQSA